MNSLSRGLGGPAIPARSDTVLADIAALEMKAREYETEAKSEQTRRLYASDWRHFEQWCEWNGFLALPTAPETLRLYIADLAGTLKADGEVAYKPATIARRVASITSVNRDAGHHHRLARSEQVSNVNKGVRRLRGTAQRRMRPLLLNDIKAILASMDYVRWPGGVTAFRDAFVLLAGFAGAFRRSEIASLQVRHVNVDLHDGLHVHLEHSKTDQERKGAVTPLPFGTSAQTCVVCAWVRWMRLVEGTSQGRQATMRLIFGADSWDSWEHVCRSPGRIQADPDTPLLRAVRKDGHILSAGISGDGLHALVKRRAELAGFTDQVGFHSLRAGFITQSRRNGADARSIRLQTRHSSDAMIDVYDREYVPLAGNAVLKLGL
jgi:site-specific recombinase XerD